MRAFVIGSFAMRQGTAGHARVCDMPFVARQKAGNKNDAFAQNQSNTSQPG